MAGPAAPPPAAVAWPPAATSGGGEAVHLDVSADLLPNLYVRSAAATFARRCACRNASYFASAAAPSSLRPTEFVHGCLVPSSTDILNEVFGVGRLVQGTVSKVLLLLLVGFCVAAATKLTLLARCRTSHIARCPR